MTDLIAGQIDGVVDNPPTVMSHIRAGTIIPLAVAAKERLAVLPDVPTAAEAGLPGWEASSWFGVVAPAGDAARHHPAAACGNRQGGAPAVDGEVHHASPAPAWSATARRNSPQLIVDERRKWGEIITSANITAQ